MKVTLIETIAQNETEITNLNTEKLSVEEDRTTLQKEITRLNATNEDLTHKLVC